jgi:hypothetical protein
MIAAFFVLRYMMAYWIPEDKIVTSNKPFFILAANVVFLVLQCGIPNPLLKV